jgi:Ca2+-transporting ATPase
MTPRRLSLENLSGVPCSERGLDPAQVSSQRERFGWNDIVEVVGNPAWELLRDTLRDPMIWFLVGIGAVFLAVGETSDAVVLLLAIIPLLFMDAVLHRRTQVSTAALRGQLSATCRAIRSGVECALPSRELVPGDLVVLRPGDDLPADGIFETTDELQVDESTLTGESLPVSKHLWKAETSAWTAGAEHSLPLDVLGQAGTRVLSGTGRLRVLFTGTATAYGEIVQSVSRLPHERTPLQQSIARLVGRLIGAAAVFCLLLAGVRLWQGHGWLDALLSAATLAVAAIPEEFPVVFTFFLGVGVYRLALQKALVRRSVSVENIGRVSVICTDKTGTITQGQLTLTHLVAVDDENRLLHAAIGASRPDAIDPVDLAILELGSRNGQSPLAREVVFPFTEDRKREAALLVRPEGGWLAVVKGAPETIFGLCSMSEEERGRWQGSAERLASEGHKVLACGAKPLDSRADRSEPSSGYEFLGLLAFEDPARPEVPAAIRYCRENRIRVIMVTGDHPRTAAAICRDVGIGDASGPIVLNAEEFPERFSAEFLGENPGVLDRMDAVARCRPIQKLAIVTALKSSGDIVAVTGDGVNDVPALQAADIGIAMGLRGTRSAREVSSIILSDDNFSTIVRAIREGRQLFVNLRRSFEYLLLFHLPFIVTAALVPLLGFPILYLPAHIVWLELLIHPTALFAFQQPAGTHADSGTHASGPAHGFFSRAEVRRILVSGVIATLVLSGLVFVESRHSIESARAQALVFLGLWSAGLTIRLSRLQTTASQWISGVSLIATVAITQIPALRTLLHLGVVPVQVWIGSVLVITVMLLSRGAFRSGT